MIMNILFQVQVSFNFIPSDFRLLAFRLFPRNRQKKFLRLERNYCIFKKVNISENHQISINF